MMDLLMGLLGVLFGLMLLLTMRAAGREAQWDDAQERRNGDRP